MRLCSLDAMVEQTACLLVRRSWAKTNNTTNGHLDG